MHELQDDEDHLLAAALAALESSGGRAATERPDLWQYPLHCVAALTQCRRVIYTTKGEWLSRLQHGRLPPDVTLLWRYGPLAPVHRRLVQSIVEQQNTPLAFVGDLDPLDLAVFATLVAEPEVPEGSFLGVSDAWLLRCESDLAHRQGRRLQQVCISMTTNERDGFERLLRLPVDWTRWIGPRAVALLHSGLKLELEGATNPDLYSAAFNETLRHEIFGNGPSSS
jgi:hypothetical protein